MARHDQRRPVVICLACKKNNHSACVNYQLAGTMYLPICDCNSEKDGK